MFLVGCYFFVGEFCSSFLPFLAFSSSRSLTCSLFTHSHLSLTLSLSLSLTHTHTHTHTHSLSQTPAQKNNPTALHLLAGGEAAMWSDEYCPAPLCAINGTYGWMADPKYDATYIESFGKQVFPKTAATGASLWNYMNVSIYSTNTLASALASHNQRLIDRSVVSCPNECHCDWGMSCGVPYLGRVTPPNLRATLVNKTPFQLKVKRKQPCNKTTGVRNVRLFWTILFFVLNDL